LAISMTAAGGVAEVLIDTPPVNALTVRDWFDLADAVTTAGRDPATAAVILLAAGRGFCAGVDIKELQREGPAAVIGCNRGCYQAFAAVYECEVPVIAAVNGHCLGGGIGLAGNADIVVADEAATFGLPEVDRGALGAATHLSRLVPPQLMRHMVYTCQPVSAHELFRHGSVYQVLPAAELHGAARAIAADIAAKDPRVIRMAKESLNGIDPVDVKRSYRFEQGFTFELNLTGISDQARNDFIGGQAAGGDAGPEA
jgi:enoyl-CoA hydratase